MKRNVVQLFYVGIYRENYGYQTYRPLCDKTLNNAPYNCRYFTYRNKNYSTILVWGLESYYISNGPIFITEGIFDAARITKRGCTAFATLTNKPPKDYRNWLQMLNRPIISICDNDTAGIKLSYYSDFFEIVPDIYKDLGNSPEDYVDYLLTKYAT